MWSEPRIARLCSRYAFVFGSPKGLPYRLFVYTRCAFVFCGTPRTSSPTRKFYLPRRGELCSPAFVRDMRSFSAAPVNRKYVVGATIGRPFLHTIIVPFRATIGRPYKVFLLYSVGAIHESPVFSNTYRETKPLFVILSAGRRVRPPTEVEVLLRE